MLIIYKYKLNNLSGLNKIIIKNKNLVIQYYKKLKINFNKQLKK